MKDHTRIMDTINKIYHQDCKSLRKRSKTWQGYNRRPRIATDVHIQDYKLRF